jgi:hypothetical protein
VVFLNLKRKFLITAITILLLVVGIIGAVNSIFVNEKIYFLSIGLIILSTIMIFIIILSYIIEKFKAANPRGKGILGVSVVLIIIFTIYILEEIL